MDKENTPFSAYNIRRLRNNIQKLQAGLYPACSFFIFIYFTLSTLLSTTGNYNRVAIRLYSCMGKNHNV